MKHSEYYKFKLPPPNLRQRALDTLDRNVKAQRQLIEDLLDVSRIINGRLLLRTQPMQLTAMLENVIELFRPAATAKNLQIRADFAHECDTINGDPDRLQQVFWNLLSNSIKFTPRDGRINVRVACGAGQVKVSVSDTGKGIAPEFLPYVFERFRQADASSTRVFSGLGIGLAIVRHIVELHGGTVRADSPGEGKGATFTITLPVAAQKIEKPSPAAQLQSSAQNMALVDEQISLAGSNVLVVEDEQDTRDFLAYLLRQHGAEVVSVESVHDAMTALETLRPDIIISDIAMPVEDGHALIRRVRAGQPEIRDVPVIALTAYVKDIDQSRLLQEGFNRHLAKPVAPTDLVRAVAEITGRAAPSAAGE